MALNPTTIEPLLRAWTAGDLAARDALLHQVYPDLKRIASRHLAHDATGHTLNTTALVHEAYVDLIGRDAPAWQGRAQFFAFMSTVMRHVLIDHARRRTADKRGGGAVRVALSDDLVGGESATDLAAMLDLDAAFDRLAVHAPRLAQVAECRLFGGMTDAEIGEALETSERTAARDWQRARAWLRVALTEDAGD
ncbi:MAG TPA: sigma-70 family RNA polymerase sigma factor [Gemmatimonadales bacterium]|nr:sigma-70 family RNA polymerase sigma factor [Gemmatimonadales bacterium]